MRSLATALALVLTAPAGAQENGATADAPRASAAGRCEASGEVVICPRLAFAGLLNRLDDARTNLALRTSALEVCRRNRGDERESTTRALDLERAGCDRAIDVAWKVLEPPSWLDRYLPAISFTLGVVLGGAAVALVVDALRP